MRILLVDDEADVLQAMMAIMKTVPGHTVRVAANSQKAHEHAAALGGVDLLITDVVMEPTDGFTLRAELQALYPAMHVVFISGYDLADYAEQIGEAPVMAKPVDADPLRQMIATYQEHLTATATPPTPTVSAVARVAVAQPTAVPRAVAVQSGVRAAVPAHAPQATAVPRPVVQAPMHVPLQPQAAAVPVPQATVHAAPRAVAVPQPVAQAPMPVAVQPQAAPVAQPTAVPRAAVAQPSAAPVPAPQAVVHAAPTAAFAPPPVPQVPIAVPVQPPPVPAVQPTAVARPAVVQPSAVPVPVPQANVRAAPQAVPPVPMAVPVQPQAVPAAQPSAVARPAIPQATATPVAVPQATVHAVAPVAVAPQAMPQVPTAVSVQPQVMATAQPTAVPRPAVAQPPALPVAGPPSTIRAVPQPAAAQGGGPTVVRPAPPAAAVPVPAAVAAAVPAVPGAETDPLIGVQLGDYRVQQLLGRDNWGKLYSALQLSVNRRVGLKVLDPEMAQEEHNRNRFLADARAKAAVQHPLIVSVFEADERNGLVFYTHESLDGATMEERIKQGQFLDEQTALQVMKAAAEGLHYLWSRNLAHGPLDASGLRVGADHIARLANLATADLDPSVSVENEIRALGKIIQQLVPAQSLSNGLRAFLTRMTGGANPVTSWPVVLQAVKALEPKVIPVEAAKIKAADAAAMRAMEAAMIAKRRALYISIGTLSALVVVLVVVIMRFVISNARKLDAQVLIPSGNYMVGSPEEGHKASLGEYEIDKYEVTINEYAKFIEWCKKNPDREHEFDHPRGERRITHLDDDVDKLIGKARARGATIFKVDPDSSGKNPGDPGVAVDLNSPMVAVSFWSAYAYAQWRGKILEGGIPRDLPTEEEWEAAARGTKSFKYPWGDELKLKNFNSNDGYKPLAPGSKPADGFNYWAAVDEFSKDVSDFGVVGMAGNVCEWVYRKEGNREIPLLKGGSFASEPLPMWGRILTIPADDARYVWPMGDKPKQKTPQTMGDTRLFVGDPVMASTRSLYIGFRTVKRK